MVGFDCQPYKKTVPTSHRGVLVLVLLLAVSGARDADGQQLVLDMTTERIDEAIQLTSDDKTARRFLESYVLQSRAGWGDGPLMGSFSTPFSRVVQAALTARKAGTSFTVSHVTPEVIAPELHVIVVSETAAIDDTAPAIVRTIAVAPRGSKNVDQRIEPLKRMALTKDYRDRYGVTMAGAGILVTFPLSVVSAAHEIVVEFDRTARGSTAMSACKECIVTFGLVRLR